MIHQRFKCVRNISVVAGYLYHMVNKALLNPYFWVGEKLGGGGRLTSHNNKIDAFFRETSGMTSKFPMKREMAGCLVFPQFVSGWKHGNLTTNKNKKSKRLGDLGAHGKPGKLWKTKVQTPPNRLGCRIDDQKKNIPSSLDFFYGWINLFLNLS